MSFPNANLLGPRPTKVQRFEEYLQRRWGEGCHNATRLFQELRAQGYRGGPQHGGAARDPLEEGTSPRFHTRHTEDLSKQAAMLVTRPAARLTAEQQALLDRFSTQYPALL